MINFEKSQFILISFEWENENVYVAIFKRNNFVGDIFFFFSVRKNINVNVKKTWQILFPVLAYWKFLEIAHRCLILIFDVAILVLLLHNLFVYFAQFYTSLRIIYLFSLKDDWINICNEWAKTSIDPWAS